MEWTATWYTPARISNGGISIGWTKRPRWKRLRGRRGRQGPRIRRRSSTRAAHPFRSSLAIWGNDSQRRDTEARGRVQLLHVFVDRLGLHRGGVDAAVGVGGDTFRRQEFRIGHRRRRDVVVNLSRLRAAYADAAFAAGIVRVLARRVFG